MKTRRFRPKKTGHGFWSEVVVLHDIEVAWLEDKDEAVPDTLVRARGTALHKVDDLSQVW
jgi:hypothetical protein